MGKTEVRTVPMGLGPAMEVGELPAPPPFGFQNFLRMIGVSSILLSLSIGSGEWLLGPRAVIQYGPALLWIVTVATVMQTVFNLECQRYTLATGEPILPGLLRLWPGRWFWGPVWFLICILSVSPGWAAASATALAALGLQRMPNDAVPADRQLVLMLGIVAMILVMAVVAFGSRVERTLARVSTFAVAIIFISLVIFDLWLVPPEWWWKVAAGFFSFGFLPQAGAGGSVNWVLVSGFAAYAATGGVLNMAASNWIRDRGWGMGGQVGYIPALIGGRKVEVSETGKIFDITAESLRRFREWLRYARWEQWALYCTGCLVGMYLCVLLAVGLIAPGTELKGQYDVAAIQAQAVAAQLGAFGWVWVLLIGFWVLWGTQLAATDAVVRHLTDLLWSFGPGTRRLARNDIRTIYYFILTLITLWLAFLFVRGTPLGLVLLVANMAGVAFVLGGVGVAWLNSRVLPPELRSGWLSRLVLVAMSLFYAFFVYQAAMAQFGR
ncbi:MAG TPA: Nramp family divalent metal transporter [Thermaerobacter sp.]